MTSDIILFHIYIWVKGILVCTSIEIYKSDFIYIESILNASVYFNISHFLVKKCKILGIPLSFSVIYIYVNIW